MVESPGNAGPASSEREVLLLARDVQWSLRNLNTQVQLKLQMAPFQFWSSTLSQSIPKLSHNRLTGALSSDNIFIINPQDQIAFL